MTQTRTPHDLCELADAAATMHRYENTVSYAAESIAMDPGYAYGYGALSVGLVGLERYDEAIKQAEKAIGLDPTDPWFYRLVAEAHYWNAEYEKAIQWLKEAIALEPEEPWAHQRLGMILDEQGRTWAAIDSLTHSLELDPEDEHTLVALAQAHLNFDEPEIAEQYCRNALTISPTYSEAFNALGACLEKTKRNDEAAKAYKAAVLADPECQLAKDNLFRVTSKLWLCTLAHRRTDSPWLRNCLVPQQPPWTIEAVHRTDRNWNVIGGLRK